MGGRGASHTSCILILCYNGQTVNPVHCALSGRGHEKEEEEEES